MEAHHHDALLCVGFVCLSLPAVRNFTVFAPTDKAIQQAFRSGALNYPYLFARNKTLLEGIVAYHAVPQYQFAGPSKQTLNMKTLLTEVSGLSQDGSSHPVLVHLFESMGGLWLVPLHRVW